MEACPRPPGRAAGSLGEGSGLQPRRCRSSTVTFKAKGKSMQTPIDASQFRRIMSRFATGVTVVTTRSGQEVHGLTCNAFCSISLAPCTVMVSVAKDARSWPLIDRSRIFAVNILSEDQTAISDRFAGRHRDKDDDRFEGIEWTTAVTGAPVLEGDPGVPGLPGGPGLRRRNPHAFPGGGGRPEPGRFPAASGLLRIRATWGSTASRRCELDPQNLTGGLQL